MTAVAAAPSAPAAPVRAPGGAPVPATTSVVLAGEHFVAAALYLVAGAIGLVWIAPELAAGTYLSPHVAGITHLFTLGWLTTTIFGALYQLLPVALGAPLRSVKVGHASWLAFAPGAGLFAAGVASSSTMLHHAGIGLIATGIVLTLGNIGSALPRARSRDVTWSAVVIAMCFLASTLVLGVALLHNLHTGFLADARVRVLAVHLHVALVGWGLLMMVGVSHRLLPMFLLSHGADTSWTKRAIALLTGGVLALGSGLATRTTALEWAGVALLEAGLACFLWQVFSFYRVRVRRKTEAGMHFAGTALVFLTTSAALGAALLARGGEGHPQLATAYVLTGLLGGIVLYVVGFFYRIVPLLAWTVRYGKRMGSGTAPTVAQMFSSRVAHIQLVVMTLGVTLLASGVGAGSAHVARCGAVLFLVGVVLFMTQLVRVSVGGAR